MWRSNSLAALACLGAAACTTVGPDFVEPAAPGDVGYAMAGDHAPAAVRLSPEARAAGAWWDAFGSPKLDQVIRQALAGSPTLAEADAVLAKARAEADAARGGAFPQAQYAANLQRERFNTRSLGFEGFPSPTVTLYSIGGSVSYDLDLFGRQRRTAEAAEARVEAQARRADAAYLTLTGEVALQAIRIATLTEEIAALDEVLANDRRLLDRAQAATRAGGAAPTAVVTVEAQLAQDQAEAPAITRDLAAARHRLALLVGRSPGEWSAPDFTFADFILPSDLPVSLPSSLVKRRPDILAAEADLHAALADVGVATARLYPDVSLSAALTQTALKPGDLLDYGASGWNIGAGLTGPIFDGGALRAKRESARAEVRAAEARYRRTVLNAFTQVSDAMAAIANDDEILRALATGRGFAQKNLRDLSTAYRLGGGGVLPVLDAQRQLADGLRDVVKAKGQRYADMVRLLTATASPGPLNQAVAAGPAPGASR